MAPKTRIGIGTLALLMLVLWLGIKSDSSSSQAVLNLTDSETQPCPGNLRTPQRTEGDVREPEGGNGVESVSWDAWWKEQENRKAGIKDACRGIPRVDLLQELLSKRKGLSHLLVDDRHKAIYCYIPKVGCTNWKKIWLILTGKSNFTDTASIPGDKIHTLQTKMALNDQKVEVLRHKLETYTAMIVVRDPFQRLLSAYRDKIQPGTGNKVFQKYPLRYLQSKKKKNVGYGNITWGNFVDYVTHGGSNSNEHWQLFERLCHPCAFRYDVVIRFETLLEDSERFLRLIGAPGELHFPKSNHNAKLTDYKILEQYMETLTREQVASLFNTFQRDFQIFQYD